MEANSTLTPPKLSKEFLLEIGGWRALQEGRALAESGKVLSWSYEAPLLIGTVQSGTSTVNARLKLGERLSDVENLCSCRQAREYGTICPHVIAVGLASLQEQKPVFNGNGNGNGTSTSSETEKIEEKKNSAPKIKRIAISNAPKDSKLLQLSVLLPLNFKEAWEQEKMRIILEGSIDGADVIPLDAVPRGNSHVYSVYETDRRLLKHIETLCNGETPGMWMLPKDKYTDFFERLIGHERVMFGKKESVTIAHAQVPSELGIDVLDNGEMYLHLHQKNDMPGDYLLAPGSAWRLDGNWFELLRKLPPSYKLLRSRDVILPRNAIGQFFQTELPQLEQYIQINQTERCQQLQFTKQEPRVRIELDGLLAGLSCRVEARYGSVAHSIEGLPGSKNGVRSNGWTPDPENVLSYFVRNTEAEEKIKREIASAGFLPGQRNAELYTLASENKVGFFLANVLQRWKSKWEVSFSPRMEKFLEKCDFIRPEITIQTSGENWLSLDIDFQANGTELSRVEVQKLLQTGVSHHRAANGRIIFLPTESVEQFNETLYDCQVEADGEGWKINKRYGSYLQGVLQLGEWNISEKSNWQAAADLKEYEELPLHDSMDKILRGYQKTGVNWLHYVARNNFGGILADEMGLGKTVQTLAYIDYRKRHSLSQKTTLIIGPTSLVQNWFLEAARFTPELSVLTLQGPNRKELFPQIEKHDIAITSYSLLRRDIDELKKFEFDIVVLDEAQNIKNRASQNAQSAKTLNAQNHLVLTGTPMENSLLDLWSIFDFLMPGYLGPATEFRDRYETPIAKNGDEKSLARLQQRIRPFVLRRTKEEVIRDLPPKLEQIAYCELTDDQRSVYQSILEQSRRQVFENASAKQPTGKDRLAILTALMRLRQVCCHLHLLPGFDEKEWDRPSAKMDYFLELLDEAVDGGHRILVFSQFVSLLKLIEAEVKKNEIPYCYFDGSTKDRQSIIDRFQTSNDIPVFLISLKAGGTGLNLTGADTVIHLDPWWNPAVEDQATARAHRMGQTRPVTSYKLIARGTVEEKIVQLQQKKKDLIASTVVSEEAFTQSLTWEELQGLLE